MGVIEYVGLLGNRGEEEEEEEAGEEDQIAPSAFLTAGVACSLILFQPPAGACICRILLERQPCFTLILQRRTEHDGRPRMWHQPSRFIEMANMGSRLASEMVSQVKSWFVEPRKKEGCSYPGVMEAFQWSVRL